MSFSNKKKSDPVKPVEIEVKPVETETKSVEVEIKQEPVVEVKSSGRSAEAELYRKENAKKFIGKDKDKKERSAECLAYRAMCKKKNPNIFKS